MKTFKETQKQEKPDYVMLVVGIVLMAMMCFAFTKAMDGPEKKEVIIKKVHIDQKKGSGS